ncbi:hypothetical protein JNUCC42_16555 [Brevibacterium sp. JNUCC-42]|nr:hypothetical protein JNUCC42_16555 [Brevibacterium sp. JNUCC-42]
MNLWQITIQIVQVLYNLVGIFLILGVYIGLKQLKLMKKDQYDKNKRIAVEKSLEYLNFFATNFIPNVSKYTSDLNKEITDYEDTKHLFDGTFFLHLDTLPKGIIAETIIREKYGCLNLFNQLEFFSVAVLNGVMDEDIVFTPLSGAIVKFVESEHVAISLLRSKGAPYKNLLKLYRKWKTRMEVEELELQKQIAEHKIKEKGTDHKSTTPIGFN